MRTAFIYFLLLAAFSFNRTGVRGMYFVEALLNKFGDHINKILLWDESSGALEWAISTIKPE